MDTWERFQLSAPGKKNPHPSGKTLKKGPMRCGTVHEVPDSHAKNDRVSRG